MWEDVSGKQEEKSSYKKQELLIFFSVLFLFGFNLRPVSSDFPNF